MTVARRVRRVLGCMVATAVAVHLLTAQPPSPADHAQGRTIERRIALTDTTQSYAIYLPSEYDSTRKYPAVFVLDPRGRALFGLGLFRAAAERLGFVVLSSYNTLSDGLVQPNVAAVNAMLSEVQTRVPVDMSRLYLAGMSGTARLAWSFSAELQGHVAGVIAASAGFPPGDANETRAARDSSFSLFLTTGVGDFNYSEVRTTAERYAGAGGYARLVITPGGHGWPPDSVCAAALEWLQLRAMRARLRLADSVWIAAHGEGELASARNLDTTGQWDGAARRYTEIARDYPGSPATPFAIARGHALDTTQALVRYRRQTARVMEEEAGRARSLALEVTRLRGSPATPSAKEVSDRLAVPALLLRARGADTVDAPAARRMLALISVSLAFYEPRSYLEAGQPLRALVMLQAATAIAPLNPQACALGRKALAAVAEKDEWFGRACPVTTP